MAAYAKLADLRKHWPGLPEDREDEAEQKLDEASIEVRALYPDVDARLAAGTLDPDVPRLVVCRMVKRAMDTSRGELAGVGNIQESAGPFARTMTFTNPDGNLYLSKADKRLLAAGRPARKAWTIHPGGTP